MKLLWYVLVLVAFGTTKHVYSQTTSTEATQRSATTRALEMSADTVATRRTPVYPKAIQGWDVPLSQRERPAGIVINRLIIHHTTNTGDESPYFKRKNERSSCPTWYVTSNGEVIEFIDPVKRPSSTGAAND